MLFREYCAYVREHYQPRNADLYYLHDGLVVPAVTGAVQQRTPAALRTVAAEVHPGVYAFDLLPAGICADLIAELEWIEAWCWQHQLHPIRPNTMNHYGAVLDIFGFAPFLRRMMCAYVAPFAALFFPEVGGAALDSHHGFVVEYQPGKDVQLDFHVDASEVTLNVCLGKEFTGGSLYFQGVRCGQHQETPPQPGEEFEWQHRPGTAVLHRGRHRHGANAITSGARYNLILWCKSSRFASQFDETDCPSWCGWNGRKTMA